MSSIDNRIVNMKFDNAKFEKGVAETTKTLSNFNANLGAISGKSVDFGNLADGVDTVASRFTWLGDLGFQAMQRINGAILDAANRIKQYGELIANPFEGMNDGFAEYELKMGSIQTILAGVRKEFGSEEEALAEVNKQLNELNTYSDKTIYSFKDMTQNIGKFINAGVNLKDSVAAIKGISNAAALSGANSNEASRSMYNFAQALSKGSVALIDWKSIELANMATVEFKQQLIDSAVAVGTLTKASDGMYNVTGTKNMMNATQNFNDTLKDEWLTTEVLIDTLKDYTDENTEVGRAATAAAQEVKTFSMLIDTLKESLGSGWAQTWELVFGDFLEAKALWTDVNNVLSDMVGSNADARNKLLETWKTFGGRDTLITGLADMFKSLISVLGAVKQGFREIFPPMTANSLINLTKNFAKFMEILKPSEQTLKSIMRIFRGLFAAVDLVIMPFRAIFNVLSNLVAPFFDVTSAGGSFLDVILDMIADLADFISSIRKCFKEFTNFSDLFANIKDNAELFWFDMKDGFINLFGTIEAIVEKGLNSIQIFLKKFVPSVGKAFDIFRFDGMKFDMASFKRFAEKFFGMMKSAFSGIGTVLAGLFNIGDISFDLALFKVRFKMLGLNVIEGFKEGLVTGLKAVGTYIVGGVHAFIELFKGILGIHSPSTVFYEFGINVWEGFINGLNFVFNKVVTGLVWMTTELTAVGAKIFLGLSQGLILAIDVIGSGIAGIMNVAGTSLNGFTGMLANMDLRPLDYMKQKFDELNVENSTFGNVVKIFQNIINFFRPVYDWARNVLGSTITFIREQFNALDFSDLLSKLAAGTAVIGEIGIIKFIYNLSDMMGQLTSGLGGFSDIAGAISHTIDEIGNVFQAFTLKIKAEALRSIAISIGILAAVMLALSLVNLGTIVNGLTPIATIMGGLILSMKAMKGVNIGSGASFLATATGITLMALALSQLGEVNVLGAIAAAGAMYILLSGVKTFANTVDPNKLKEISGVMIKFSAGLWIMAKAIASLGSIPFLDLVQGLIGFFVAFVGIGMIVEKFPIKDLGNLLNLAAGMWVFAQAIKAFAGIEWLVFGKGILFLGVALTVIGAAMRAFPDNSKGITGLSGMAIAMTILLIPLKVLGAMDFWSLIKGIGAIGIALFMMATALSFVADGGKNMKGAASTLAIMSAALILLTIPIKMLGAMDFWKELVPGLVALGIALGGLVVALNFMPTGETTLQMAASIIAIAAAIGALMVVIKYTGDMDWGVLVKGLIALAGATTAMVLAVNFMPDNLGSIALGIAAVAAAFAGLMYMIKDVGTSLNFEQFLIGIGSLVATLGVIFLAVKFAPGLVDMLKLAAGLIAIGAGLLLLTAPLIILSNLSWNRLIDGFIVLGIVIGVVVVASMLLSSVVPYIIAFGVALLAVGAGIYLTVIAFEKLADVMGNVWKAIKNFFSKLWSTITFGYFDKTAEEVEEGAKKIDEAGKKNLNAKELEKRANEYAKEAEAASKKEVKALQDAGETLGSAAPEAADKANEETVKLFTDNSVERTEESGDKISKAAADMTNMTADDIKKLSKSVLSGDVDMSSLPKSVQDMVKQLNVQSSGVDTKTMSKDIQSLFNQSNASAQNGCGTLNQSLQNCNTRQANNLSLVNAKTSRGKFKLSSLPLQYQTIFNASRGQVVIGGKKLHNDILNFKAMVDKDGYIDGDKLPKAVYDMLAKSSQVFQKEGPKFQQEMSKWMSPTELIDAYNRGLISIENTGMEAFIGGQVYYVRKEGSKVISEALGTAGKNGAIAFNEETLKRLEDGSLNLVGAHIKTVKKFGNEVKEHWGTIIKMNAEAIKTDTTKAIEETKKTWKDFFATDEGSKFAVNFLKERDFEGDAKAIEDRLQLLFKEMGMKITDPMELTIEQLDVKMGQAFDSLLFNIEAKAPAASEASGVVGTEIINKLIELAGPETMEGLGKDSVSGLITGILSKKPELKGAVDELVKSIPEETRKLLNINSPSKVMETIGSQVNEGLANGVSKNITKVTSVGKTLGEETKKSITNSLSNINISDVDLNPTITPVLDLSNVNKGASGISSILNKQTVGVSVAAKSVDTRLTQRQKITDNNAVRASDQNNTQSSNFVMNNTYNVKNENDARQISNKLGALMNRYQYSKGVIA